MNPRSLSGRIPCAAAAALLAIVGCHPTIREDRTITFAPDGTASFQHGPNGVYTTDKATVKPKRIYEARPEDVAISPPLGDPAGKRTVFCVARAANGASQPLRDGPADGRRYAETPVRYSCWLFEPTEAGDRLERLFEVDCGHAGAIAAGLCVAWHTNGDRLDFIARLSDNAHHVRTFDLRTRESQPASLPTASRIVLGSASKSTPRTALLSGMANAGGLWIGNNDTNEWWRAPNTAPGDCELEHLRLRRPVWSRDGTQLAFADGNAIAVCHLASRTTSTWRGAIDQRLPVDIHWHPNGKQIGFREQENSFPSFGPVLFVDASGVQKVIVEKLVTAFAGWDKDGRRMAYVTLEPPQIDGAPWGALWIPNLNARTSVRVADADGTNAKTLIAGPRATFPHWSSTDNRLSVWLTEEPPWRLTTGSNAGLRPGDPAALIDPDTGTLT